MRLTTFASSFKATELLILWSYCSVNLRTPIVENSVSISANYVPVSNYFMSCVKFQTSPPTWHWWEHFDVCFN